MQNVMQALYLTRNARGLPACARRYSRDGNEHTSGYQQQNARTYRNAAYRGFLLFTYGPSGAIMAMLPNTL